MDPVKKAFAETIQELVQRQVQRSGLPKVEEQYDGPISFEFIRLGDLSCRVQVNQGRYEDTLFFDVVVKEHRE